MYSNKSATRQKAEEMMEEVTRETSRGGNGLEIRLILNWRLTTCRSLFKTPTVRKIENLTIKVMRAS